MIPIWAYLAAALAIFGAGTVSGWQTHSWKADAAELARIERDAKDAFKRVEMVDKSSADFEAGQADASAHDAAMQKEVIRVVTKTEYRDACLDDDGLRILRADVDASNTRRQLAPAVPAASGPASGPE